MAYVFRILTSVPYTNRPPVEDVCAKLHSYFTYNILIGAAVLVSYKQFAGRPIECFIPNELHSSAGQYFENFCFSSDTYYVPLTSAIEKLSTEERKELHINYYKWIPFFLLFQAACFKFPALVWKFFHGQSGMRVGEIIRLTTNDSNTDPKIRSQNIQALCHHLQRVLKFHYRLKTRHLKPHKIIRLLNIKYSSYYVFLIYMVGKMLFLVNAVCQFCLMNKFLLPPDVHFSAYEVWSDIFSGNTSWKESGIFPRITLCDISIRASGQERKYTSQCVLMINIFTEKIFVTLWAWYMILGSWTLINMTNWFFSVMTSFSAEHFIYKHLEMSGQELFMSENKKDSSEIHIYLRRFINKYLQADGVFILWLIAQHSDILFITDLIYQMWESHYKIERRRESLREVDPKWKKYLKKTELNKALDVETGHPFLSNSNIRKSSQASIIRTGSLQNLDDITLPSVEYHDFHNR